MKQTPENKNSPVTVSVHFLQTAHIHSIDRNTVQSIILNFTCIINIRLLVFSQGIMYKRTIFIALCHSVELFAVVVSDMQTSMRWWMRTRLWLQATWSLLWRYTVSHVVLVTTATPAGRTFCTSLCRSSTAEPSCITASMPLPLNTFHGLLQTFPVCII